MKFLKFICLLAISAVIFAGCDPQFNFRKVLQNNTDHDLMVIRFDRVSDKPIDTVVITKSGSSKLFVNSDILTPATCVESKDSLVCKLKDISSNLKVTKNLNEENNWSKEKTGNRNKGYMTTCKITINRGDIN